MAPHPGDLPFWYRDDRPAVMAQNHAPCTAKRHEGSATTALCGATAGTSAASTTRCYLHLQSSEKPSLLTSRSRSFPSRMQSHGRSTGMDQSNILGILHACCMQPIFKQHNAAQHVHGCTRCMSPNYLVSGLRHLSCRLLLPKVSP